MKKLLCLTLALIMACTLFAACGSAPASGAAASGADSPAASTSAPADKGEPTNIVWMIRFDEPANTEAVMAELNKKLLADLNMTLDMRFIAPGDYQTKMEMAMAGGDDWDLCFTAAWANNYVNAAGKGAYLALDDLLPQYAPDHMKEIPESFWDGVRVNGKIYGMINYQVMFDQGGQQLRKDVVDALKIDVNSIKSYADLTKVLGQIQEAYPDQYATRGGGPINLQATFQDPHISLVMSAPFLAYDPATKKISNTLYFDKNTDAFEAFQAWHKNGYAPADAATLKDENTLLQQGMLANRYQRFKPGAATQIKNNTGHEWYVIPTGEAYIDTNAVQSTLTAVNVNSKNPEKAVEMYNYFFSNKDAFNMLIYGIEGTDYELTTDGRYKRIDGGYSAPAWMLGNQFNAYVNEKDDADIWEQTKKSNSEANLDPLYGFVADRAPIETEIATCEAVWLEYKDILSYGLQDYKTVIAEMQAKLEKAGLAKVTEEIQKQVDAFLAAKA